MSRPKDINNPSPWNMRIWDVEEKQWLADNDQDLLPYYGFDIRGGEVTAFQGIDWIYKQHERWNEFIWERSTGLTDKNGVEIYEGDIVTWIDGLMIKHTFEVEWQENRAKFCLRDLEDDFDYDDICDKMKPYMEVIGNIHESRGVATTKGGEE